MSGFAAIGLHRPKDRANVGGVIRAAQCYGASLIAIAGDRNNCGVRHATNTTKAERHIPVIRGGDLREIAPFSAIPVAVDLVADAIPLPRFAHPKTAYYIFGPEDGTLGGELLRWCKYRVAIPTAYCMNLAATVNVILYDRLAKGASL